MADVIASPVFLKATFTGNTGVGPIAVNGLEVGDIAFGISNSGLNLGLFESQVSVTNEFQQTSVLDTSGYGPITVYFMRAPS